MDSNFAALQQLHSSLRVAIYCRLSKDDNLDGESASIHNQRDMLETWCQEHGFTVASVYADASGKIGLNQKTFSARGGTDIVLFLFWKKGGKDENKGINHL